MKRIILVIMLLSITSLANAEVYLIINSQTKEIYSASEKNDTVVPNGYELVTLTGGFENYELADNITNYKYSGKKFILNTAKINAQEQARVTEAEVQAEAEIIKTKMADIAIADLKANGMVFNHEEAAKNKAKE